MQNEILKLQEIIFEITSECKNNCSYCGSKEVTNIATDEDRIRNIVDKIAEYGKIDKINISGGDPLLVSYETHKYLVNTLKNIKEKTILINPKSLIKESVSSTPSYIQDIFCIYSWIGISINTKEELNIYKNYKKEHNRYGSKYTIITNFNTTNIFMFDEIEKFVKEQDLMWQIQYTIYKDENNEKAIYNNEEAFIYFQEKINKSNARIVLADNCNNGRCGAGLHSIGITYDGNVLPCLSMRSWIGDKNLPWQGSVFIEGMTLEDIWENNFRDYRFKEFKCCKDHCKNKAINKIAKVTIDTVTITQQEWDKITPLYGIQKDYPQKVYPAKFPDVSVYSVVTPNVMAYAVQGSGWGSTCSDDIFGNVDVYGVFTDENKIK